MKRFGGGFWQEFADVFVRWVIRRSKFRYIRRGVVGRFGRVSNVKGKKSLYFYAFFVGKNAPETLILLALWLV